MWQKFSAFVQSLQSDTEIVIKGQKGIFQNIYWSVLIFNIIRIWTPLHMFSFLVDQMIRVQATWIIVLTNKDFFQNS